MLTELRQSARGDSAPPIKTEANADVRGVGVAFISSTEEDTDVRKVVYEASSFWEKWWFQVS